MIRLLSLNYATIKNIYSIIKTMINLNQDDNLNNFGYSLLDDKQFINRIRNQYPSNIIQELGINVVSEDGLIEELTILHNEIQKNNNNLFTNKEIHERLTNANNQPNFSKKNIVDLDHDVDLIFDDIHTVIFF